MAGRVDVNIVHQRLAHTAHFDQELQVVALKDMLAVHTGVPPEQQCLSSEKSDSVARGGLKLYDAISSGTPVLVAFSGF